MSEENKKIKILTLSDHPLSPSGVGTQTRYVENTKFSKQGQKHVISGRTSDTLSKQSAYLRSTKIEDSTDMNFNIKYMKLKKLKILILIFFIFIFRKCHISFDYDEVRTKIYKMQKNATKSVEN